MHYSTLPITLLLTFSSITSTYGAVVPPRNPSFSSTVTRPASMFTEANMFNDILMGSLGQVGAGMPWAVQLQGAITSYKPSRASKRSNSDRPSRRHEAFQKNQRRNQMKIVVPPTLETDDSSLEKRSIFQGSTAGFHGFGIGPVIVPQVQYVIQPATIPTAPIVLAATTPKTLPSWPSSGGMIAAAYYPDWEGTSLPPSKVNYALFDLINFAFAIPTANFDLQFTQDNSGALLTEMVTLAHAANTKVMLSIGGWSSSNYFSEAVSTSTNRQTFVNNIVKFSQLYNVQGIDIDWEYPSALGAGNPNSPEDTTNFLAFLILLKSTLASGQRISACVTAQAFIGPDGSPLTDVSAFATVLDTILIMNYDVWGASQTPGPNSPLNNACPDSNQPKANEQSSIDTWVAAGFPANKILMGVPSYGYVSSSSATTLVHKRKMMKRDNVVDVVAGEAGLNNRLRAMAARTQAEELKAANSQTSQMRRWFEAGQKKVEKRNLALSIEKRAERKRNGDLIKLNKKSTIVMCPNNHSGKPCVDAVDQVAANIKWSPIAEAKAATIAPVGGNVKGIFNGVASIGKLGDGTIDIASNGNQIEFWQLVSNGLLVKQNQSFVAVNGYTRAWDACSSTPYLYDTARNVVITYDDPQSMLLKGQLAAKNGIAGMNMWDMSGDTSDWDIVHSYRTGMGLLNP